MLKGNHGSTWVRSSLQIIYIAAPSDATDILGSTFLGAIKPLKNGQVFTEILYFLDWEIELFIMAQHNSPVLSFIRYVSAKFTF